MNKAAEQSITGMLNCFPQTNQDYQVLLLTLSRLLDGQSDSAIINAADRFAAGDVPGQSKTFAPATPEFVAEVRNQEEYLSLKARPRIEAPAYRRGPLTPGEMRRQRALQDHAHLPVLHEDIGHDQWLKFVRSKQLPTGAVWVACLGIVYGPEAKQ